VVQLVERFASLHRIAAVDHDLRTLLRKGIGDRSPNTSGPSGDTGNLAIEHSHGLPFLRFVRVYSTVDFDR
jgi:hypothetical protein